MSYALRGLEPWAVRDGFRVVAACPTKEASEAAARLLGVTPMWLMSEAQQKAVLDETQRAVDAAFARWAAAGV